MSLRLGYKTAQIQLLMYEYLLQYDEKAPNKILSFLCLSGCVLKKKTYVLNEIYQ